MSAKKGSLESLRVRIRRLQFIVGLGFLSLVMGVLLSGSLAMRLGHRIQELPGSALRLLVSVALEELWVLAVLPVLCYGAARIVELRPLSTAVGAALGGQTFVLLIDFARSGSLLPSDGWRLAVLRSVAFGVGIYLSQRAIQQGRAAAAQQASAARAQAEAKKSEYDEFLREAERDGERVAQREAERAAAAAMVAAAPVEAPAVSAAPAPESTTPPEGEAPAPVSKASGA